MAGAWYNRRVKKRRKWKKQENIPKRKQNAHFLRLINLESKKKDRKKHMDYTEVSIETTRPGAEELTAVLEDVAQGFVIDDSQDVQDLLEMRKRMCCFLMTRSSIRLFH